MGWPIVQQILSVIGHLLLALTLTSCSPAPDRRSPGTKFQDPAIPANEEGAAPSVKFLFSDHKHTGSLVRAKGGPWSFIKTTFPDNYVRRTPEKEETHFQAYAVPSSDIVSKASANFTDFKLTPGAITELSFCLKAASNTDLSNVFIADLECVFCWPHDTSTANPSPGIRLHLKDRQGYPVIERAKIGLERSSLRPAPSKQIGIPRERWIPIVWRVQIGDDDMSGWARLDVDQQSIINAEGQTIFTEAAFAKANVEPISQHYDSLEMGVTANASGKPVAVEMKHISFVELKSADAPGPPLDCVGTP